MLKNIVVKKKYIYKSIHIFMWLFDSGGNPTFLSASGSTSPLSGPVHTIMWWRKDGKIGPQALWSVKLKAINNVHNSHGYLHLVGLRIGSRR